MNDSLEVRYEVRDEASCPFCGAHNPDAEHKTLRVHIRHEREDPFRRGNIITGLTLTKEQAIELAKLIDAACIGDVPNVKRWPLHPPQIS